MKYTKHDIIRMVEEEDVEFIRLQFTDIFGALKNIAITSSQLLRALDNRCKFDGSLIEGFVEVDESELYLYPDLDTFEIFPWRPQQGKVARMICDIYNPDGTPFEADPRYILKKVLKQVEEMGYRADIGSECEFFLFHTGDDGQPTTVTHEKGGYFDVGPLDLGENARRDIILNLEDMGFEIESSHHESAPAQHEIDFKYDEALKAADNITTFKLVVKAIAKRHGLYASFMPKPVAGPEGSGMHINLSLEKDGKNVFYNSEDELGLSSEAYSFIAGILEHMKGSTAIHNPIVNSYKRLIPGYGAPVYIGWTAKGGRRPLMRAVVNGENTRVELRSPDPSANPYLSFALCLAAGLDGIKRGLVPPSVIEKSRTEEMESIPETLKESIIALQKDEFLKGVLGKHISERYISVKTAEWDEYRAQVTAWELNEYLHRI
jgi:glutamine synthetase